MWKWFDLARAWLTKYGERSGGVPSGALFALGRVQVTPGVTQAGAQLSHVVACLERHVRGDFGLLREVDCQVNALAIADGGRVLSAYALDPALPSLGYGDNTLWIITDGDRTHTTILLPDEYC